MALLKSNTIIYGTANIQGQLVVGSVSSNASVNISTGSLIVVGGLGVSGNIYSGNILFSTTSSGITFRDGTVQTTAGDQTARTTANLANTLAQTAFDKANTANTLAQGAYDKANTANTFAQSGFDKANTANTLAQGAYDKANNSLANTGTVVTTNSLTQFKFANTFPATSNTTGSVVISGGLGVGANLYANTIFDILGEARTIIQNAQSGVSSYTLVATDAGKHIYVTGTGGVTCPISVFTVGQAITIVNNTAASITITAPSAGTLYLAGTATTGNRTLAQRGIATLIYVIGGATPTVISSGAGLS
jgi:hypothetical protein